MGAGAFSPDGHALALATSDAGTPHTSRGVVVYQLDHTLVVSDPSTARRFDTVDAYAVAWTPDSTRIIATDHTGIARIDPATGHATYPVRWNRDETYQVVVLNN